MDPEAPAIDPFGIFGSLCGRTITGIALSDDPTSDEFSGECSDLALTLDDGRTVLLSAYGREAFGIVAQDVTHIDDNPVTAEPADRCNDPAVDWRGQQCHCTRPEGHLGRHHAGLGETGVWWTTGDTARPLLKD